MGLLAVEIRWHRLRIRTQERKGRRYGALEMSERIDYRGYRVEIGPDRKGLEGGYLCAGVGNTVARKSFDALGKSF